MTGQSPILVLDTATRRAVLGLAAAGGRLIAADAWTAGHRHGEELLARLDRLLADNGITPAGLGAIVAGTGPGSFTGLRIGLATAKVLAYSLGLPIVGVATSRALGRAAVAALGGAAEMVIALPAGAHDRYIARVRATDGGTLEEIAAPEITLAVPESGPGVVLVAVDLEVPEVPAAAIDLGRAALDGLAAALAVDGATALAAGRHDDASTLVPAYVALPRGIAAAAQEMAWSPDLR